jgi:hypothetical protein
MKIFHATFGVKYAHEPHPSGFTKEVNPNGYITIEAPDEMSAREFMKARYDNAYAFMYPDAAFSAHLHPLGELARFKVVQGGQLITGMQ